MSIQRVYGLNALDYGPMIHEITLTIKKYHLLLIPSSRFKMFDTFLSV